MLFITAIKFQKLLKQGCEGYLCNVVEAETPKTSLYSIPIVQEFSDAFSKEIPSMPTPREVEFCIDLIPGSSPISRAPYWMKLMKHKELKIQLHELL